MKKVKLDEIVEITAGYTFRTKTEEDENGVPVVFAKDLNNQFFVEDQNLKKVVIENPENISSKLQNNDIIFSNKGFLRAGIYNSDNLAIPTSSVLKLSVKNKKEVLPEYLAILLNSSEIKRQLEREMIGATIKTLSVAELRNFKIDLVDLEKQKKIIELFKIINELKNKIEKKQKLIDSVFESTLTKIIK